MNIEINKMCQWEREKAVFLIGVAEDLGMNIDSYGEVAVNPNSGYTYIWLEDFDFSLYMPINCELVKSDVWALWSNPNNGAEIEKQLEEDTTLEDLEQWANELNEGVEE